jgi:hypothetical protein
VRKPGAGCQLNCIHQLVAGGSGEGVKTIQELMRHANSRLTLDV